MQTTNENSTVDQVCDYRLANPKDSGITDVVFTEATQNDYVHYSMALVIDYAQMDFNYVHVILEGSYHCVRVPTKTPKDVNLNLENHSIVLPPAIHDSNLGHPDLGHLSTVFLLRSTLGQVVV